MPPNNEVTSDYSEGYVPYSWDDYSEQTYDTHNENLRRMVGETSTGEDIVHYAKEAPGRIATAAKNYIINTPRNVEGTPTQNIGPVYGLEALGLTGAAKSIDDTILDQSLNSLIRGGSETTGQVIGGTAGGTGGAAIGGPLTSAAGAVGGAGTGGVIGERIGRNITNLLDEMIGSLTGNENRIRKEDTAKDIFMRNATGEALFGETPRALSGNVVPKRAGTAFDPELTPRTPASPMQADINVGTQRLQSALELPEGARRELANVISGGDKLLTGSLGISKERAADLMEIDPSEAVSALRDMGVFAAGSTEGVTRNIRTLLHSAEGKGALKSKLDTLSDAIKANEVALGKLRPISARNIQQRELISVSSLGKPGEQMVPSGEILDQFGKKVMEVRPSFDNLGDVMKTNPKTLSGELATSAAAVHSGSAEQRADFQERVVTGINDMLTAPTKLDGLSRGVDFLDALSSFESTNYGGRGLDITMTRWARQQRSELVKQRDAYVKEIAPEIYDEFRQTRGLLSLAMGMKDPLAASSTASASQLFKDQLQDTSFSASPQGSFFERGKLTEASQRMLGLMPVPGQDRAITSSGLADVLRSSVTDLAQAQRKLGFPVTGRDFGQGLGTTLRIGADEMKQASINAFRSYIRKQPAELFLKRKNLIPLAIRNGVLGVDEANERLKAGLKNGTIKASDGWLGHKEIVKGQESLLDESEDTSSNLPQDYK